MIIDYKNVRLCHDGRVVLDGVNISVGEGEMIYLMGQVGSGKSTLLGSMYGDVAVTGEQALVLSTSMIGLKTSKLPMLRRRVGIVHQELRLLPDRTVYENLDFVLRATDWKDSAARAKRISEVLEWVELGDVAGKYPYQLSGGQKQCICIARAILNSPGLILADEPTGQLDSENGERVMALLDEVRRQCGTAVVVSTHNSQWPKDFPGRVYICADETVKPLD